MATNPSQDELLLGVGSWAATTNVDYNKMNEELDEMAKSPSASKKHGKQKGRGSKSHRKGDKKGNSSKA
ncbi:hypothetical protein PG996_011102 [Apiospora saccharicola]|uniref:Uncharacterized protein n=1 Tax=Apiospora saccharicola TaxID=335842 RepID=A0ABR1UE54_9PEZI